MGTHRDAAMVTLVEVKDEQIFLFFYRPYGLVCILVAYLLFAPAGAQARRADRKKLGVRFRSPLVGAEKGESLGRATGFFPRATEAARRPLF